VARETGVVHAPPEVAVVVGSAHVRAPQGVMVDAVMVDAGSGRNLRGERTMPPRAEDNAAEVATFGR
jgi:hypothetical protein